MDITLKQLQAFVAVAEQGSFRKAAALLNTTQPNISSRISTLEAQLGHSLMRRDAGSVRMTPRGETMLARARNVLNALDSFTAAAENDALFDGKLRLGVTEMIVHSWLGAFLKATTKRFPNVDVELTFDYSARLSELLNDRALDLALQTGPFDRPLAGTLSLGEYTMIWVASPDLEVTNKPDMSDLSQHTILTHARGTLPYEQIAAHVTDGVRLVPSTNIAACLQMTLDGLGIACLPRAMVRSDLASGRLTALDYPWRPDPLAFFARYDAETAPTFVSETAEIAVSTSAEFKADNNKYF